MKADNDLIKKFGVGKIIHGLVGVLISAVCVVAFVLLFRVSFLSVLSSMALGTAVAYLAGKWKELKDDVPDTANIRTTVRSAYLVVSITLLIWSAIWITRLSF